MTHIWKKWFQISLWMHTRHVYTKFDFYLCSMPLVEQDTSYYLNDWENLLILNWNVRARAYERFQKDYYTEPDRLIETVIFPDAAIKNISSENKSLVKMLYRNWKFNCQFIRLVFGSFVHFFEAPKHFIVIDSLIVAFT